MIEKKHSGGTVFIWTDGSCLGNPGIGAWAAFMCVQNGKRSLEKVIHGTDGETTNNRMELMAVIMAFEALKKPCDVVLACDSEYVIRGIVSQAVYPKNRDLWIRLQAAIKPHNVFCEKVKAHSGEYYNEYVNKVAQEEARKLKKFLTGC